MKDKLFYFEALLIYLILVIYFLKVSVNKEIILNKIKKLLVACQIDSKNHEIILVQFPKRIYLKATCLKNDGNSI